MKEKVEFRKIREFSDTIGDTILFIKQNLKGLIKSVFALCGIFIVAGIVSMVLQQIQMHDYRQMSIGRTYSSGLWGVFSWEYFVLIFMLMANYASMVVVILSYISLYIQKGNVAPNLEEIWSYFKHYFLRVLGSSIITTILFSIGSMLCLVPGIWLFPIFTIFYPIMVLENGGFGHSFNRSFSLIKGEWWVTFATLLITMIITMICYYIISAPAIVIQMIDTITHFGKPINTTYTIISAISTYLAQIFMIIPIICSALIYHNLVERKESSGLLNRIDSLGNNNNYTAPSESIPEEY